MSGEEFNPEASRENISTATADNPNAADIVQQELSAARENMSPDDYNAWLTEMQHGADGEGGPEQGVDSKVWGMVEFYDSTLNENSQYEDAPLPGGTPEDPSRILHTEEVPGGEEDRPTLIVAEDGTSTGLHYNADGQIDAYNQTLPDGTHRQYRQGEDGAWAVLDGDGNPVEGEQANVSQAFVDKEGNFVTQFNGPDNQPVNISVGGQNWKRGDDGKWTGPENVTGNVTNVYLDENHQVNYETDDGRKVTNAADGTEITTQPDGVTVHRDKPGGEPTKYEKDGYSFTQRDGKWWYHNDKDGGDYVSVDKPELNYKGEIEATQTGWGVFGDSLIALDGEGH